MAMLYPPYIEGKIPAQPIVINENGEKSLTLRIPFQMNRAIGYKEMENAGISALIKSIATNSIIKKIDRSTNGRIIKESNNSYIAEFVVTDLKNFVIGQYYKIQLAFGNDGPYSTVGIFKCAGMPKVFIKELSELSGNISPVQEVYTGMYQAYIKYKEGTNEPEEHDTQEKVYEYKFDLIDQNNEIIETSGRIAHNAANDSSAQESFDTYSFRTDLETQHYYKVQYTVYTNNGLEISSPSYYIYNNFEPDVNTDLDLVATPNPDKGCIELSLVYKKSGEYFGRFKILRKQNNIWDELATMVLDYNASKPENKLIYEDDTIQQGIKYLYAIQQYDEDTNLYAAKKIIKQLISCDFEDAYLQDKDHTLKIKFNPKISSFKTNVLENKLETIGGKFPFIFRNGFTEYKEFSVSGLISCLMDDENLFYLNQNTVTNCRNNTPSKAEIQNYYSTDLVEENIAKERQFKLDVLAWLNNGQPKLFRSPAEGNYIVRLMNISLSPEDKLSRMLHTFSSTAYEIAECNYQNLKFYSMLNQPKEDSKAEHEMVFLNQNYQVEEDIYFDEVKSITIQNAKKGSQFVIYFSDEEKVIQIGYSGKYYIESSEKNPIIGIKINPMVQGTIIVKYSGRQSYPLNYSTENYRAEVLALSARQRLNQFYYQDGEDKNLAFMVNLPEIKNPELYPFTEDSNVEKIPVRREITKDKIIFARVKSRPARLEEEAPVDLADPISLIVKKDNEGYGYYLPILNATERLEAEDFHFKITKGEEKDKTFDEINPYQNNQSDIFVSSWPQVLWEYHYDKNEPITSIQIGKGLLLEVFYDESEKVLKNYEEVKSNVI